MSEKVPAWKSEGEGMRLLGLGLGAIGCFAWFTGYAADTTVPSTSILSGSMNSVYNLGALQRQMMIIHTGLSMFVAGTLLYGSGIIVQQLARLREVLPANLASPIKPDSAGLTDE